MKKLLISINCVVEVPDDTDIDNLYCSIEKNEFHLCDGFKFYSNTLQSYSTEIVEELEEDE